MKGEVQLQPPPVLQNPSDSDPLLDHQEEDESPVSSSEIKDEEDIEGGSLPCCRICLESDAEPGKYSCQCFQICAKFYLGLKLLTCELWLFRCCESSSPEFDFDSLNNQVRTFSYDMFFMI